MARHWEREVGREGGRDYAIVWHRKCEATRCNYGNIQLDEGVSRRGCKP